MNKKLLVTLGPSSFEEGIIKKMTAMGVDLFRINLSHTKVEKLEKLIKLIRKYTSVPLCIDSEGAQIRTQEVINGKAVLEKDSIIKISVENILCDAENISFVPNGIARFFKINDVIRIDFNHASIKIIEKQKTNFLAKVLSRGVIGSNKAVDLNRDISLPAITEKDRQAIKIGKDTGVKFFALSFANTVEDVKNFRKLTGNDSIIISKIESRPGLMNLNSILKKTDQILIDRGDLSRQVQIEKIPFLQMRIISIAKLFNIPVNVATNLLESMITNRSPTRAEVNDIVSTILMGADGLVLAAETAIGEHPIESVKIVRNIISHCRKWTPNTNMLEILEM